MSPVVPSRADLDAFLDALPGPETPYDVAVGRMERAVEAARAEAVAAEAAARAVNARREDLIRRAGAMVGGLPPRVAE